MLEKITPEIIAAALFALAGIGTYLRTKPGPALTDAAYTIKGPASEVVRHLERIAQALEDIAAQGKDSFQQEMRNKLAKLDEIDEAIERMHQDRQDNPRRGR